MGAEPEGEVSPASTQSAANASRGRLLLIVRLCHELANANSLDAMFAAVVQALSVGTGLQRTAVLTLDGAGAMRFRSFRGLSDAYRARVDGHSPWPRDCRDPREILVDDVTTHPMTRDLVPVLAAEGIASLVFLPLVADGRLLGKFMLYAEQVTDWQSTDLPFARAVADLLASFLLREETSERLLQARKMESLGLLAGGIAHDFNNLLTAILGHAEMLKLDLPPGTPQRENTEQLLRVVGEATDLTRQMLDFARPRPLQIEVLDLAAMIADAQRALSSLLRPDLELVVIGTNQTLPVKANRSQLMQVLRNLVTNARDAMPHGGCITLAVQAATTPAGASVIELAVSDQGLGMDDELRTRIFEPLFTTKHPGRGTGLGLSICYGIVTHLGGDITVTSKPGRGSTFLVTLPMASEPVVVLPTPPEAPTGSTHDLSVLLVEDQDAVRHALRTGLAAHHCTTTEAASGEEALARLATGGPYDIVVSDIVMPEMDGIALTERVRRKLPNQPVLLITGYAELAGEVPRHLPLMQKPFTPGELAKRIREIVPHRRQPVGTP